MNEFNQSLFWSEFVGKIDMHVSVLSIGALNTYNADMQLKFLLKTVRY